MTMQGGARFYVLCDWCKAKESACASMICGADDGTETATGEEMGIAQSLERA